MYRWIEAGLLDQPVEPIRARYHPRPPVPTKLEPYQPLIQARLTEFPALQASLPHHPAGPFVGHRRAGAAEEL